MPRMPWTPITVGPSFGETAAPGPIPPGHIGGGPSADPYEWVLVMPTYASGPTGSYQFGHASMMTSPVIQMPITGNDGGALHAGDTGLLVVAAANQTGMSVTDPLCTWTELGTIAAGYTTLHVFGATLTEHAAGDAVTAVASFNTPMCGAVFGLTGAGALVGTATDTGKDSTYWTTPAAKGSNVVPVVGSWTLMPEDPAGAVHIGSLTASYEQFTVSRLHVP